MRFLLKLALPPLLMTVSLLAAGPALAASQAPVAAENGMVVTAQHLSTPTRVARCWAVTTMPFSAATGACEAAWAALQAIAIADSRRV